MNQSHPDATIRGNPFNEKDYFTTDVKTGVAVNRSGTRTVCLTNDFLGGFWQAFVEECGPAAAEVMISCGRVYGERFAKRFLKEVEAHFDTAVAELPLSYFQACLIECLAIHGFGRAGFDWQYQDRGVVIVTATHTPMAAVLGESERPCETLLSGILAGFLSTVAGRKLACLQTACIACGESQATFVVTIAERLADSDQWMEDGWSHARIVTELVSQGEAAA